VEFEVRSPSRFPCGRGLSGARGAALVARLLAALVVGDTVRVEVATDPPAPEVEGTPEADDETRREGDSAPVLDEHVTVRARQDDLSGIASAASEGVVGAANLARRPLLRPGEIVETVPGLIATQHSGGGKANQYFLRGFNLDHGTDLRIDVEGMQVNLPTHGHGQGYADLNFLIPELIDRVHFRKGTYEPAVGDFSSAGSADVRLVRELPFTAELGAGGDAYGRALVAGSTGWQGGTMLGAFEYRAYDGPWVMPEDFRKVNGLATYSRGGERRGWSVTGMAYEGVWDATDQIPRRVADVTIDRFGFVDSALGGDSSRYSLSGEIHRLRPERRVDAGAWLMQYDLDLLSNFTYCLDEVDGDGACEIDDDQFLQRDERLVLGAHVARTDVTTWSGRKLLWSYGAQAQRHDIDNGLYRTEAGQVRPEPAGTVRQDEVQQLVAGGFADLEVRWRGTLRTRVGLRADYYDAEVASDLALNSGERDDALVSPKLNLALGPWNTTEVYASWGRGFHSNDARGVIATVDPVTLEPVERADPLVRATGTELGVRTAVIDGLHASLALFQVELDSELLFVGDAGTTEAGPPSRRVGVEFASFLRPRPWIALDFDATLARAKLEDVPPGADRIPGAIEETVAAGLALGKDAGWSGGLRWRYFGPPALIEDGSVRGSSTSLLNGRIAYGFGRSMRLTLDGFNLLDREDADIQYFYASRLPDSLAPGGLPEPAEGVEDVHFHPMESRTLRLWFEVVLDEKAGPG
jgi:hypothetical protein